jgi:hypothetical protein
MLEKVPIDRLRICLNFIFMLYDEIVLRDVTIPYP